MMGRQAAGAALMPALAQGAQFGPVAYAVDNQQSDQAMRAQFAALGGEAGRLGIIGVRDDEAPACTG